jgi:hypothetical protein
MIRQWFPVVLCLGCGLGSLGVGAHQGNRVLVALGVAAVLVALASWLYLSRAEATAKVRQSRRKRLEEILVLNNE